MPTICFVMIMKDEAHVIERCLRSVFPHVDKVLLVDTGSTDDTIKIASGLMQDYRVPGDIIKRPWVNFEHNRNEALQIAQRAFGCDYVLTIDADEVFATSQPDIRNVLDNFTNVHAYDVMVSYAGISYTRRAIFKPLDFGYQGVVHEVLWPLIVAPVIEQLHDATILVHHEGARSRDPDTYKNDAALLAAHIKQHGADPRSQFYLAQSYRDAGMHNRAFVAYAERADMPDGWDQETWYAVYQMAKLSVLQDGINIAIRHFTRAIEMDPSRPEPYYYAGIAYAETKQWHTALLYLREVLGCEQSTKLFYERDIHVIYGPLQFAIALYYCGHFSDSYRVNKLLLCAKLPDNVAAQVNVNMAHAWSFMTEDERRVQA